MTFAYADPPYPGMARALYRDHPDFAGEVDHAALVGRLVADCDGWALSTTSNALRDILPLCPEKARVAAWCKPFAFMRPNVWPTYAWEPVIFMRPARKHRRSEMTPLDWLRCNPVGVSSRERAQGGVKGQKPEAFSRWLFLLLDLRPGDDLIDLYPGSGRVGRAWEQASQSLALTVGAASPPPAAEPAP